mgnify:FL=1
MRKIVFDLETKNVFHDVGTNDPAKLDLSVAGVYDSETDTYTAYLEEDLPKLWPILERADMLIGFNSEHFDIPLLNKYYPGDLTKIKSIDLMRAIKDALGRRIKLDTIAEATLGRKKIGHGLEAIGWWQNGEVERVKKYCLEDVRITKELYEYAVAHKSLKYLDGGKIIPLKIDTTGWEEAGDHTLTQVLPF